MKKEYKILRKKLRPVKIIYFKILDIISKFLVKFTPNIILDASLERKKFCKKGSVSFSLRDYGKICRFRVKTFLEKEPDTLKWIESFNKNSVFIDVGANMGIYSLYASYFVNKVYCFEPDSLNYSLLNLNILDNQLSDKVFAYSIAVHNSSRFDKLNIQKYQYGGALSTFHYKEDQFKKKFDPSFRQGAYSLTLENIFQSLIKPDVKINQEIHCKIDVDGNEKYILEGSKKILENKIIKSFLVELDNTRDDYIEVINMFKVYDYSLVSKKSSPIFSDFFETTQNHIFYAN